MSIKSIIDIDVNDAKFKQFSELWQKYQTTLAKMPSAWADAAKEQGKGASELERMTAALLAHNHLIQAGEDEDKKRLTRLTHSERLWTSMAKSSGSMAKNILDIGAGVLKWGTIVAGGLLGGSLFGIDRMARDVSNSRRSSMGLGLTPGQQKAFGIDLGRFVDPDSFLGGINAAVTDISKQGALNSLGVNTKGSTEDVAIATLKAIRARALATPTDQLGLIASMYHLSDLGIGVEDLRRQKSTSSEEFEAQLARYRTDSKGLDLPPDVAKNWTEFTAQMARAGSTIYKTIVVGLIPLEKPLEHLSASFTKFATTMLTGNGPIKKGIDDIGHWLETFSGEIGSPEFLKSTQMFVSDVGWLAHALHKVAHPLDTARNWTTDKLGEFNEWMQPTPAGVASSIGAYNNYLARKDLEFGFPKGLLENLKKTESGDSLYPAISKKGAIGTFQFMPDTARQYGINAFDPVQSANAGPRYLYDLEQKYKGDLAKALAAYNWGPGNLDADIKAHPRDWANYAPKETQDYVRKVGGINIVVSNNTGGSAHLAINALAGGP